MKKITLWLFALFACWQINAQVTAYTFATGTAGTLDPMTGSTQILAAPNDDTVSAALTNIGFTFNYAGVDHTSFIVSPDGWMKLGATGGNSFTNSAANAGTQSPIIMPYWDDLALGSLAGGGQVHYVLTGTAPNRRLIVEWFLTVPRNTTGAANARFQCILNETTNVIEFVYGSGMNAVTNGYTIGLATSETLFNTVAITTNTNSTATFTTNNLAAIPTGTTFTWTPPACGAPGGLNASLVSNSTATISWGAPVPGPATGYEYFYSDTNTPPAAAGTATVNTSEGLTGLNANTTYYAWVRSDCSSGVFSSWSGPIVFKTLCNPFIAPWTYDVEAAAATTNASIADCWSTIPVGPTTAAYRWNVDGAGGTPSSPTTGPSGANSGNNYFYTEASSGATGAVAELYSPLVDLSGLTDPSLQFFYHMHGANMGELRVDVFDGTTWTNNVFVIAGVQQTANTQPWREAIISLNAFIGNTVQVRFRSIRGDGFNSDMALDDITFDEAPACFNPINLGVANITATTVDVLFTDGSGGNQFDFAYVVQPQGTGAPTTYPAGTAEDGSNSANGINYVIPVTSLNSNTAYEIYVAADCNGTWVGPVNFRTLCVSVTDFNEGFETTTGALFPDCWAKVGPSGSAYTQASTGIAGARNIYMYSSSAASRPVVSMIAVSNASAGTHRMKMKVRGNFSAGETIELGYLTNPTDATTFTSISSIITNSTTVAQDFITVPSGMPAGDVVFALRTGTALLSVLIDDVVWEPIPAAAPSCATNIIATPNATCGNFANIIAWDVTSGADGYYVFIGTTPGGTQVSNGTTPITTNSFSFTGTISTTYYYTIVPFNAIGSATGCIEASFTTVATGCYCTSAPTSVDGNGITNVQIGLTNFPSTVTVAPFYNDFTSTPVDMTQGITNNVQISYDTGFGYSYPYAIFIDANDDFTFDASEIVTTGTVSNNPAIQTVNASFVMPGTIPLGNHRMRIVTADSAFDAPNPFNPCYSGTWGETLDFTVNIVASSCTPPVATATIVPDCINNQFSVDINVTALGDGTPTITDGTTTWPVSSTGVVNVGPFLSGSSVTLTVLHGADATCNLPLAAITYTCPPANDECSGAIALTVNTDFSCAVQTLGTITAATASAVDATACFGTENDDVWFSFVATATTHRVQLNNVVGTTTDLYHSLWTGTDCGTLTLVPGTCSDPNTSNPTGLTIGTTYYVRVYSWANAVHSVSFNICIGTPPAPPVNDTCANAIAVDCSDVVTGSTANGATDTGNNASADVWYSYSGAAGDITASLCTNTNFDTFIRVFDTCGGTQIASNDDSCGTQSSVTFTANGTSTYYIMVEGYGTATGSFELTIACVLNADSFDNNNFMAYPNPVKDVLNLSYTSEISTVTVMNMLGQEVISRNLNATTAQVDMSQLSAGAYIVNVTIGDTVKTIKVVKQ